MPPSSVHRSVVSPHGCVEVKPSQITIGAAAAAVVAGLVLTACSSSPSQPSVGQLVTTSSAPSTTTTSQVATTVPAPVTSTTQSTTGQASPGFAAAKDQWVQGASAISANQGTYWDQAATDLANAASSAGPQSASYMTAVQELHQLAALPETSETATQMAEAQQDTSALDSFFGTPGLYD